MFEELDFIYLPSTDVEAELRGRGAEVGPRFGFPDGEAVEVVRSGPQRIAVYERSRPERAASIVGRRDF
ncbi:MAG TPA: hypothetical protein VNS19_18575 [Acidimicrobiales bacterium]|nr:hypothetical protein [Acidimicrobiales bacterium]